jgi:DNA-formamidopyrimidine glycosylase
MPEGPECRRIGEALAKRLSGRTITSIDVLSGRYESKPPSGMQELTVNLPITIVGAGVHGKFLYWILKDEHSVWNTLGMTGGWSESVEKHSRVKITLNDGAVYFNDMRNFGTIKFVRGKFRLLEKLKSLGPDMLAEDVNDEVFIKRMKSQSHLQVTVALMNQSIVAGVGNYIKSDSLWLARINPHKKVSELSDVELCNLNRSIKHIMRESFNTGGATSGAYNAGEYTSRHLVYNQKHDPDGNPVVREMTEDKRTTHWCPNVQI